MTDDQFDALDGIFRSAAQNILEPVGGTITGIDGDFMLESDDVPWTSFCVRLDGARVFLTYLMSGHMVLAYVTHKGGAWEERDHLEVSGTTPSELLPHLIGFMSQVRSKYVEDNPLYDPERLKQLDEEEMLFWDQVVAELELQ